MKYNLGRVICMSGLIVVGIRIGRRVDLIDVNCLLMLREKLFWSLKSDVERSLVIDLPNLNTRNYEN
jgi:hypothetical protein